jgi:hypothetical protein
MLCTNARPKSISGRTSYHPARLEFHRYPQLIPECRTARGFGPPVRFRGPSSWSWIDRRVSGLVCATKTPYSGSLSLWLRSRRNLTKQHRTNSSAHSSIGTLSRILLPAPTPCKHTVSDTISSPSRAAFQLSITVLVHYRSVGVFSLTTSSWLLPTRFLEPRRTLDQEHMWRIFISSTGLSPSLVPLSSGFNYEILLTCPSLGGRTFLSATLIMRRPKPITKIRGQTCVQLGISAHMKNLGCSAFARRY